VGALDDFVDNVRAAARGDGPTPFAYATVATVTAGTPPVVTVDWNNAIHSALCPRHWTTSDIALATRS
jgi:hypothetical protein